MLQLRWLMLLPDGVNISFLQKRRVRDEVRPFVEKLHGFLEETKMSNLNRNRIQEIVKELENSVARPECLTCDCFQGLLTQLELDCPEDISNLTSRLKTSTEKMHSCLGCDPCPAGALFAQYLKSKINESKNNINIKELIVMETEKKKKSMLETIWESMTKTGGCCGGGGNCCGPAKKEDEKAAEQKDKEESDK